MEQSRPVAAGHVVERRVEMAEHVESRVLVSTEWADAHKDDSNVVFVEIDENIEAYDDGHIPGAISWNASPRILIN